MCVVLGIKHTLWCMPGNPQCEACINNDKASLFIDVPSKGLYGRNRVSRKERLLATQLERAKGGSSLEKLSEQGRIGLALVWCTVENKK